MSNPQSPDPVSSRPDLPDSPLPADPLLRNGSFIDVNAQPSVIPNTEATPQQSSASVNGAQSASPLKSRRKVPIAAASPPSDATSWLPAGWMVEERVRANGATAGTSDKYYIEPVTGRRFRSKKEVQYYLETGDTLQNKRKKEAANLKPDENSPDISGNQKDKKASKKTKGPQMTFDHTNVPDGVEWFLTDVSDDEWTPYVGGEKVPEYTKQCWEFEMEEWIEGKKK